MIDEGYIKFDCRWTDGAPSSAAEIAPLKRWRNHLHRLGLIGVYPDGIGYGNVSARRRDSDRFIISGTQTGAIAELDEQGFTLVNGFNIEGNALACVGPVRASSESLTHAAIYISLPDAGAVLHIHHLGAWESLCGVLPTTREDVPYGTPAMAYEIERLVRESDLRAVSVAVMAGHREGIIAFGGDPDEAGERLLATLHGYI